MFLALPEPLYLCTKKSKKSIDESKEIFAFIIGASVFGIM